LRYICFFHINSIILFFLCANIHLPIYNYLVQNYLQMSTTKSGKSKFIHDVKGPAVLTIDVITDIVNGRKLTSARKTLAERHGISENRVNSIWKEYYGGTTLKHFESGLKKQIPTTRADSDEAHTRKYKSERGVYTAKDPKVLDSADAKAKVVRKVAPQKKIKTRDLDLDNVEDMDDNDAEIIAGEVVNGNNSVELMAAMTELIESNKHLSATAVMSLKQAQLYAKKNYREDNIDSEIETDTDDSTAIYSKRKQPSRRERNRLPEISSSGSGEDSEESVECVGANRNAVLLRKTASTGNIKRMEEPPRTRELPGNRERAQPIYRTSGDAGTEERAVQVNNSAYGRSQPPVYQPQRNSSQTRVQPHNSYGGDQQCAQPDPRGGVYSAGRYGVGQAVQGVPWLARRT
jgi:hypothetical protein